MRQIVVFLLAAFLTFPLFGQEEAAKRVVESFWTTQKGNDIVSNITLVGGLNNGVFLPINQRDLYDTYLFNIGVEDGFVIVAGVDNNIIGYSPKGHIELSDIPDNFKKSLMLASTRTNSKNSSFAKQLDEGYSYNDIDTINFPDSISPLLGENEWGQQFPYNMYCPIINDTICPTGCVATAMAQVLGYWKKPERGIGSKTYNYNKDNEISVDFSKTVYDWSNICDKYSSKSTNAQNQAIAELMYHCGVAMEMKYKTKSSSPSGISYVEDAYRKYFGYGNMHIIENKYFSDKTWTKYLKTELINGRPIEYSGKDTIKTEISGKDTIKVVAHAFVIDGYDKNDRYHVNWGWRGKLNGYFSLGALMPDDANYSSDCWATINTIPNDYITENCEKMYFPVAESMESSISNIKLGNKFNVTIKGLKNAGCDTLIGNVGLGLYKLDGTHILSDYFWDDFSDLKRGTHFTTDKKQHSFIIPAYLDDGFYYIRAIFKPSDKNSDIFLYGIYGQPNYLCVEVKDGTASIYSPKKEKIKLRVDSIAFRGKHLCKNFKSELSLKITNAEDANRFHSYIGIMLSNENDPSDKHLISKKYVDLSPQETKTFTFIDTIYANVGAYRLYAMYDIDNLPVNCEDLYSIDGPIEAKIIEVERPKLVVTQEFEVENKDNVPKDKIQVHDIHVRNDGAPLNGFVKAGVYNQSIEKWVGTFDKQDVDIANGEEAILSFESPYMNLENGEYMLFVRYGGFDSHLYCAYSAGDGVRHYARFTLTDASDIRTVANSNSKFDVYTLYGKRILSNVDIESVKSTLARGIYIIKDKMTVRKILVR